jgi:dCMP deaminase
MRFLQMAKMISSWSKDPSTKCGCVIVRPDKTIHGMGFNGFPRGLPDSPSLYDERTEKYARVIHAEMNALMNGIGRDLTNCTSYTWPPGHSPSCDRCASHLVHAGIRNFVHVYEETEASQRWNPTTSLKILTAAGAQITRYPRQLFDDLEIKS